MGPVERERENKKGRPQIEAYNQVSFTNGMFVVVLVS